MASKSFSITRRHVTRLLLGGAALACVGTAPAAAEPPSRPNIVVILADDVGFSDIESFGGEIPTPNLDALAKNGLRFTQFYNNARCSPSRAALLTGLHPHQAGLGHLEPIVIPGSRGLQGRLSDRAVTIAEVLGDAGYSTVIAGKWHLGLSHGVGPWQRGFARSIISPVGELYFPDQTAKNAQTVYVDGRAIPASSPELGRDWYSSDLFVARGLDFAREAQAAGKPFLLYLPFVAAHFPLMAPPEDVARFRGRYMSGWDKLREQRFARQKALGIIPRDAALPAPLPESYDWEKLSPADRERFDTMMAVYAATIARMDKAIGDLVAGLKAAGTYENTLILFMSDNGGTGESGPDGRLAGDRPGDSRSTVWTGMNWAMLQNTPFSYFKHHTDEGGIATPLIAHWPRGIAPAQRGTTVDAPGHLIDVMPSLLDVTGATYPRERRGQAIIPMQGRSFVPAFHGAALARAEPLFWEHEGHRAVRDGRWKLVSQYGKPWRLYDLATDRTETRDLAKAHPPRVVAMAAQWDIWAAASFVDPWTDDYDPYLPKGEPRRSWGGDGVPKRPHAQRLANP